MGDVLGGAVTYVENLPNIVRCGLLRGGNWLALHFGAFAPWDKMNLATKTSLRNLRVGDPIAIIYVPSATLARYGAGVAFNGTFMVFDIIPFYEIKSIRVGKCNEGKCLDIENVKRAYSKCVENESVLSWFRWFVPRVGPDVPSLRSSRGRRRFDMVDRANEIRDEISKTIILNDENWEGLRCRICPSCAATIPTCFCICLECEAQLISTGRFYVNINSDDDDDDHEPNVSGDARRAQEEANGNTAARGRVDGMDDDPDDDEMGTQVYTSGNVSEEEENEEDYRDNDTTARDIINSQQIAICLDEPREAQYMAVRCRCQRCGGCLTPRLKGLPHVHTTTATPTSLCLIVLVSSCHLTRKRFLVLRVFDQGLSDQSRTTANIFAFRRPSAMGCASSTKCGVRQISSTSPRKK